MSALLPAAAKRIRPFILLLQFAGNAILGLLAIAWLQIPDSHTWQLVFSAVLAVMIVATFLLLHALILRRLRQAVNPIALWLSAAVLFLWLLLSYAMTSAASLIEDDASRRAGYLNSQLGHSWRNFFTYEHLFVWQLEAISIIVWLLIPALLLPFVVDTVSHGLRPRSWRCGSGVLRRWQHWLAVGLASWLGYWLTTRLVDWHPNQTVNGELFSVTWRLGLVCVLDILLATLVLAIVAELLDRAARNSLAQPAAESIKPASSS